MMLRLLTVLLVATLHRAGGQALPDGNTLALVGGRVYATPAAAPIEDGIVLIEGSQIVAVGNRRQVPIPRRARVIDCRGTVITAGFWNSHIHFGEPQWNHPDSLPAARFAGLLDEEFGQFGFTTVVDLWGFDNVRAVQRRIAAGDAPGPRILRADLPIYQRGGTQNLPSSMQDAVHVVQTPAEAAAAAREIVSKGADVIKIYSGFGPEGAMPLDEVQAICGEAHGSHRLVFTHPENLAGLKAAILGGVDVVAHTLTREPVPDSLLQAMRQRKMTLIPTVKSWDYWARLQQKPEEEARGMMANALDMLRRYAGLGGSIVFGTDIGGITDHDPTEEYVLMAKAGLTWRQILAALTTAPAARLGLSAHAGTLAPGMDADLVVLGADPVRNPTAFAEVRHTIRSGRIIR